MTRSKNYTDLIFLLILGGMLVLAFYYHFSGDIIMPTSTYFGLGGWVVTFAVFFLRKDKTFLLLIALLILFTFNIINFSVAIATIGAAYNDSPIIEPLALLMLLIYVFLKRASISALWKAPSDEGQAKQQAEIDLYYKKFNESSQEELDNFIRYLNDYPSSAQIALKKVRAERQK